MRQAQSLSNRRVASSRCLLRKAKTEKYKCQDRLRVHTGIVACLMDKRAVGAWIIKSKHLLQMHP